MSARPIVSGLIIEDPAVVRGIPPIREASTSYRFTFLGVISWRIEENTNKPGWIGLFMLIPLVNLFVGYYIAFVDKGRFIE